MNRIKGLALGLGVVTLIVVGLACGAREAPAANVSGTRVAPPAPAVEPVPANECNPINDLTSCFTIWHN